MAPYKQSRVVTMRALTKPQWAMLIVTSVLALVALMSACIWQEDTSGTNTTVVAPTPVVVVSTPTATPEARPTSTATPEARPTSTATPEARSTPTATPVYDTWAHWGSDDPTEQEDSSLSSLDQSEDSDTRREIGGMALSNRISNAVRRCIINGTISRIRFSGQMTPLKSYSAITVTYGP